mmetsp:Transcript_8728/g.24064  ORF Transcript_8728/g.24064 Transcript_8728/m.24064 type:complete len:214 (+) Transcript_8728:793-1434(+)
MVQVLAGGARCVPSKARARGWSLQGHGEVKAARSLVHHHNYRPHDTCELLPLMRNPLRVHLRRGHCRPVGGPSVLRSQVEGAFDECTHEVGCLCARIHIRLEHGAKANEALPVRAARYGRLVNEGKVVGAGYKRVGESALAVGGRVETLSLCRLATILVDPRHLLGPTEIGKVAAPLDAQEGKGQVGGIREIAAHEDEAAHASKTQRRVERNG